MRGRGWYHRPVDIPEESTHSFIVSVWREDSGRSTWRGHITCVPSGDSRYFTDLNDIAAFIAPYLEAMGVRVPLGEKVRRWLRQLRSRM